MASPQSQSPAPLWITAIVAGLAVTMLLAVVSPRLFGVEDVGWVVSVVGGVLVAAAVVAYGYAKRSTRGETEEPPRRV